MTITKVSSREFNQHTSRAKRATEGGPVIITERGRPAHVLMSYEEYQQLVGTKGGVIEALGHPPGVEDADLVVPPLRDPARAADLG